MQDNIPIWRELASVGGTIVALATAVIGWLYRIMQGQVKQWKDLYEDKTKELAELQKKPDKAATDYIELYKQAISTQVTDLEKTVLSLKSQLAAKEEEIMSISTHSKENEEKLIFSVEMQEKLEREIAAYEEFIAKFMGQFAFSEQVITAFSHGEFEISKIKGDTSQLQNRLNDIAATSYRRTRQHLQENVDRAAAQKAAAVQRALKEKKALAEQGQIRMKMAAPMPMSDNSGCDPRVDAEPKDRQRSPRKR